MRITQEVRGDHRDKRDPKERVVPWLYFYKLIDFVIHLLIFIEEQYTYRKFLTLLSACSMNFQNEYNVTSS